MNISLRYSAGVLVCFFCIFCSVVSARASSDERDSLYSHALQELRYIQVTIPDNYIPGSDETYTTIYMVDGEWNTENMAFIHRFARNEGYLPHAVLVGISNIYIDGRNQRDRDFLPANNVEAFLDFIEDELIPFVEDRYPAGSDRILFGHSYGGVFSMYTLLTRPHLFESYIASDPPFIWNDRYLIRLAEETLREQHDLNKTLWIAGIEATYNNMGIDSMHAVLETNAPEPLFWKSVAYPNETHNSVRLKGIYDGLKFIYDGYNAQLQFHPRGGIILNDEPIVLFTFSDNPAAVRYTTDGTFPDASSAKIDQVIPLTGPATVTMRYMTARGLYDKIVTGNFEFGEYLPAHEKPDNVQQGIWNYSYYEGEWIRLPDFNSIEPVSQGIMDADIDVRMFPRSEHFACRIEGYIQILDEGYHVFIVDSDDGAKLYIDDTLLIDHDGLHGRGEPGSYIIPLQKGFYPIRIEYFQAEQDYGLDLYYVTPVMAEPRPVPIPADVRYGRK
jgi:predicted alpha/beta superfamily hydrolase